MTSPKFVLIWKRAAITKHKQTCAKQIHQYIPKYLPQVICGRLLNFAYPTLTSVMFEIPDDDNFWEVNEQK